jgi:serine/threonine protein kinase
MIDLPIRVAAPDVTHVDALAPGTRLGEFEILGLIGVGGFGMVYRAYDHSLQRDVAIKEYMPTALASRSADVLNISVRTSSDQETFRTGLESFVGEARMLAKFEHPSLVKVFRFWEANNTAYMVMPLYRGMTLKQARLRMRTPPSEAWLRKVLWSVLGALKVLHRGKALHRDVSPDNIFLQDIGPPVLLDLGAARLAISDRARQHTAVLKVNFAPIEQYADVKDMLQGPWTDLYSLSAVVHGLLCNEPPMPATIRVVNDSMPPVASVARTVAAEFGLRYSTEFVTGIAWGLSIRPQDRPQSVQEFAKALMLSTPNGMSSFDWRAELGPACLPEGEVLELPGAPGQPDPTRPDPDKHAYPPTQLFRAKTATPDTDDQDEESPTLLATDQAESERASARTEPHTHARSMPEGGRPSSKGASLASTEPMALASNEGQPGHHPSKSWLLLSAVGVLILIGATWSWRASTKPPAVMAAPEVSTPATPNAALTHAPTALGAPPVAAASSAEPVSAASEPAKPGDSPATATATPAAAPLDHASAPLAAASDKTAKSAKATLARRPMPAAPIKVETPRPLIVAEPAPTPTAPAPAPARPAPKPEPALSAEKLCANEGFITKPMCVYRACQRADLASTAFCVEQEQRFKRAAENNSR